MEARTTLDLSSVFGVLYRLMEVGFVVLDPTGEIDIASDKARELLGCEDRLELTRCHPEAEEAVREMVKAVRTRGLRSMQKEIRIELDGTAQHVSLAVHPIDEKDCSGYLLLAKDAEGVRRMATDLRMAAQFRNTRRLHRAVVENLNRPLSAIKLHADLLRDKLMPDEENGETPSEVRSLDVIRKQIDELHHTLTLLREEIDPADGEERAFSLRDVVDDVVRLIEPQAAQQDVEIVVVNGDHAARLNGSRQRIKQAVLNLAVNALDAMPEGGTLTFELDAADGRAALRIIDTGVGIDQTVLPHIFEMHFTTKNTGTGVGLYVARQVVERHEGSVDVVASEIGEGSTFEVTLPVSDMPS